MERERGGSLRFEIRINDRIIRFRIGISRGRESISGKTTGNQLAILGDSLSRGYEKSRYILHRDLQVFIVKLFVQICINHRDITCKAVRIHHKILMLIR